MSPFSGSGRRSSAMSTWSSAWATGRWFADEVWGINAAADVIACDRVFHMDDVRIQEIRAAAAPESNIAAMLQWLKTHPGPVYTSRAHPDYPGLVDYPLADVMNACGGVAYFNSTAPMRSPLRCISASRRSRCSAATSATPIRTRPNSGRGCVEFYLGMAKARGIAIGLPNTTSLMDGIATNNERLYGYDTLDIEIDHDATTRSPCKFTPTRRCRRLPRSNIVTTTRNRPRRTSVPRLPQERRNETLDHRPCGLRACRARRPCHRAERQPLGRPGRDLEHRLRRRDQRGVRRRAADRWRRQDRSGCRGGHRSRQCRRCGL
jgi:hypothetical protein